MIVIGYIYNNNGMATWCIESAYAIHESGKSVLLIHHPSIHLNNNYPFKTLAFELPEEKFKGIRILKPLWLLKQILSSKGTQFTKLLLNTLQCKDVSVEFFLLNQSNLVSESIGVPQYVCSWAHPLSLKHYIKTTRFAIKSYFNIKDVFLRFSSAIGYFFKDKKAFSIAEKVISISPEMHKYLLVKNYTSILASPCINIPQCINNNTFKPVRFIIVSLDLECKRKNILWLLNTINSIKGVSLDLTLVGNYGKDIESVLRYSCHNITLFGPLERDDLLDLYRKSDVFLFSSKSDDWGYVILEAMSYGLAIVAPNSYPFKYIIDNQTCLYNTSDKKALKKIILKLNNDEAFLRTSKHLSIERVKTSFSRSVFAKALLNG